MAEVRLVDLDVIRRFSLVVRQDRAPAAELLESLDLSRAAVLAAIEAERPRPARAPSRTARSATSTATAARAASGATKRTTRSAPRS